MDAPATTSHDSRAALFDLLDDVRTGMLGLTGSGQGSQPMTHFPDRAAGLIWFISSSRTDLVQSLDHGEDVEYVVIARDQATHASIRGKLYQISDDGKLEELWSPMVAVWFDGPEDPTIALLRFDPEQAELWQSTASSLRLGFEIVRANLDGDHVPDVGQRSTVHFPSTI